MDAVERRDDRSLPRDPPDLNQSSSRPQQQQQRRSRNHQEYRRERSDVHERSFRRGPPPDYWLPPHVSAAEYNSLPYAHMGHVGPSMYPYYPRPSSRSGSVVTTDTSFNQELPSRSSLEAFSKHWNFYLRNPHLFERLRVENPSHFNSLNNYYKMCGQLLNLPPIRIPKSLQMLARGEHRRHQDDLDSTRSERRDSVATTSEPPAVMAPLKFSSAHIKAVFASTLGSIAQLDAKNPTQGQKATVTFYNLESKVGKQEGLISFPGPLIPGQTHKGDVIHYCQSRIRACREQKLDLTEGEEAIFDRDSYILMYELLILFLRQNNAFDGTDVAELLVSNNNYKTAVSADQSNTNNTKKSDMTPEQVTDKFRELLLHGLKKEALDFAMQNNLWGHALFMASKMDQHSYAKVLLNFANGLEANDPLQTLYQLMSGRQPMAVKNSAHSVEWRSHLAMILANPTGGNVDFKAIVAMGDNLREKGLIYAAHFCYLMSGLAFERFVDGNVRMVLIGSDVNNEAEDRFSAFATNEAIQCTEIFEYAQRLANPHFALLPFQYYKIVYALRLLDNGMAQTALCYVEQIAKMVDIEKGVVPYPDHSMSHLGSLPLMHQLLEVAQRLKYLDPSYTTGEGEYSEMKDPQWITELSNKINALQDQLQNQQPEQHHEQHEEHHKPQQHHEHELEQQHQEHKLEQHRHQDQQHRQHELEQQHQHHEHDHLQLQEHQETEQPVMKHDRRQSEQEQMHRQQVQFKSQGQSDQQHEEHVVHQENSHYKDQQDTMNVDSHHSGHPQDPSQENDYYHQQVHQQQQQGYPMPGYYDPQAPLMGGQGQGNLVNGTNSEGFEGAEPIMMKPIPEALHEHHQPSIPMMPPQQERNVQQHQNQPPMMIPSSYQQDTNGQQYHNQSPMMMPNSPMMTSTPVDHLSPAQPASKEEPKLSSKSNEKNLDSNKDEEKSKEKSSKKDAKNDQAKQNKSQGLFGRLLGAFVKPGPNQMILPEDKTQSIVWDEEKKRWVDTTAGDDDDNAQSAAPPSDAELSRNNSMANMQQMNNMTNSNASNKFSANLGKRKAMLGRVDVFKHSQSTPVLAGALNQGGAPQPPPMAPQAPMVPQVPMEPQGAMAPQAHMAPQGPLMAPQGPLMAPMHPQNMMAPQAPLMTPMPPGEAPTTHNAPLMPHQEPMSGAVPDASTPAEAPAPVAEEAPVMMFFNPNQFPSAPSMNHGQARNAI